MTDKDKLADAIDDVESVERHMRSYGETWFADILSDAIGLIEDVLKDQKTGHWISLTDCSNGGVYCSECNTKVFDSYPFKKKFSYFCPHCGARMDGEVARR